MIVEQAVDVKAFLLSCEIIAQRFREYSPSLGSREDGFWFEDKDWSLVDQSLSVFTAGYKTRAEMRVIEARYENLRQHERTGRAYQSLISSLARWTDLLIRQRIAQL